MCEDWSVAYHTLSLARQFVRQKADVQTHRAADQSTDVEDGWLVGLAGGALTYRFA